MDTHWYGSLFQIGSRPAEAAVTARGAISVGLPLIGFLLAGDVAAGVVGGATAMFVNFADIGTTRRERVGTMLAALAAILVGGTIGDRFGGTTYADEVVVLLAALVAGWVSGSHPGVAAVARLGALATAAGAGMQIADLMVYPAILCGGVSAIGSALAAWTAFGVPASENAMDWRAGVRRAIAGKDAGPRFAICYALAASLALFSADLLGVTHAYWATLTTVMVMRREGMESLGLVVQYMAGTLAGIVLGDVLFHLTASPLIIAALATAFAACSRVAIALNPALGFAAFTVFLLLIVDLALKHAGVPPHLLHERLYDVSIGCAFALAGTLLASAGRKRSGA